MERPLPPLQENAAFVAEYRAQHELILWRWRHEVREGAAWVAQRGVEEAAYWYAGGVFFKGGGYLADWAGSVTRRALARGGEAAAGWLRTTLSRLPGDKKRQFEQLWAKAQLEGERALSAEEKNTLRALLEHLERLVKTRLDTRQKDNLRSNARGYYQELHPEFEELLMKYGREFPIHHRCPLEYAHLFPAEDINAAANLAMVRKEVHTHINRAWNRFRQLCPDPSAKQVSDATRAIDAHFEDWYHQAGDPLRRTKSLEDAEKAALRALDQLFPQ